MRVHIGHHFYGAGNLGDDIMLAGFLQALSSSGIELCLSCCSPFDLEPQMRRFPQIDWLPYTPEVRQAAIASSDGWLGLGGTPFQSDCGEWFVDHLTKEAMWCSQRQLPMWFLGVGVSNREVFELPQTRILLDCVRGIWTRDALSANLIADHFPRSKIRVSADLANIYLQRRATYNGCAPHPSYIGLCLNFEDRSMFDPRSLQAFILSARNEELAWLIQEVRKLDFSEHCLLGMFSADVKKRLDVREPCYAQATVGELLDAWGRCDRVVSSRYHAGLIQAWRGGRLSLVARSQKLMGLADQLCCPIAESIVGSNQLDKAFADAKKVSRTHLSGLARLAEGAVTQWLAELCAHAATLRPGLSN